MAEGKGVFYINFSKNLISGSYIKILGTENNLLSSSYIKNISKPILVTPIDTGSSSSEVVFVWEIPTNSGNKNIHSRIEIDSVDTFDSGDLIVKNTVQDNNFEYDNGGFIAYPVAGVTSIYYGEQARLTITLTAGTWYWRIRGEVTS